MKLFFATTAVICLIASPALSCGLIGKPPCGGFQPIAPPRPPTTMQPYGNQTFITTPGQPTTTMQTYGNQTFFSTPGRPTTTCQTYGTQTFCR